MKKQSKKSKKSKVEPIKLGPVPCKRPGCGIRAKRDGFCAGCFLKYKKGQIDAQGEETPAFAAARKKREKKQLAKQWAEDKKVLTAEFNEPKLNLLKVLQNDHPNTKQSKWCKTLGFFTCDAACYHRMFVTLYPDPACTVCHDHDGEFEWLKQKSEELKNVQKTK